MAKLWYYKTNGQQFGPVTSAQLKKLADDQTIGPNDLVRKEGMRDWFPASQVRGLFGKNPTESFTHTGGTDAWIDPLAAASSGSAHLTDTPAAIPQALPPSSPSSHTNPYPYQSAPYQPGYYVQPPPVASQANDEEIFDIPPSQRHTYIPTRAIQFR